MFRNAQLRIEPFSFGGAGPQMELLNEIDAGESGFVKAKISAKVTNANTLTDAVFQRRHPELHGRRLGKDDVALAKEWLMILHSVVEPLLPMRDEHLDRAQRMRGASVPGMPGVTIEQLLEKHRKDMTPEIPLAVLLAFIEIESGWSFKDATHGTLGNNFTSPAFYELGLFQTPGGLHGKCTADPTTLNAKGIPVIACEFQPPGKETSDASEWGKLCKQIGADPTDWTNPATQVRAGLLNLKISAVLIKKDFKDLFPTAGTDWYLRMAVLMPFAQGARPTRELLVRQRADLAKLPEDQRWGFLHGKLAPRAAANVNEKMALAAKLGYRP
jgi:hypothetical protein